MKESLAKVTVGLSQLSLELAELIDEIEINPITSGPGGIKIVDALIVLRPDTCHITNH